MIAATLAGLVRSRGDALLDSSFDLTGDAARQMRADAELLCVLARVIKGKPVLPAFGAPGDWGYNTAIGRALLTNPSLLILDEATEGLAPLVVAEIWRTIAAIRETGIATLIVDRNARAVLAHTDDAVVLEKGVVVASGPSSELGADASALARYLGVS